uniref:Transcription repressor n=1 Tax=Kalanchoe fedtschenkoi TaxID=63787 RepID=A0A7N0TBC2_KALFE
MDQKTRFKLGIPRILRSSYVSCRSRIFSDAAVGAQPVFIPPHQSSDNSPSHPAAHKPPPPPNKQPTNSNSFTSICRPKHPQAVNQVHNNTTELSKDKASGGLNLNANALFFEVAAGRHACPSASPVSSLILDREFYQNPRSKTRSSKSRSKRRSLSSSRRYSSRRLCRVDAAFDFSSSDDEDDDVFFSSRSRSSDSSDSQRLAGDGAAGCEAMMEDSVAVVKHSRDPHEDFRTSMVEMIVEKQILAGADLERLLQSFLALNSRHHHRVILEVFTEIWEALFCDWS